MLPALEPARAQEERPVPDYDGREDPPPDAGEVVLWVPRVVLYPVYLVTEYLVRWPLGTFATWFERENVGDLLEYVFTFGNSPSSAWVPTFLYEFGFRPSVGVYFWTQSAFTEGDRFAIHFAWGGRDWWRFTVRQRFALSDPASNKTEFSQDELSLAFVLSYRPDNIFWGLGPDSPQRITRYYWDQIGGQIGSEIVFGDFDGIGFALEVRDNKFGSSRGAFEVDEDELYIDDVFDVTDSQQVPGFDGYLLGELGVKLALDTRPPWPEPNTGARLELFGELGTDLTNTDRLFLNYGGEVGFFLDLTGRSRTLGLRQYVGLTERLGDGVIPFTELQSLGGPELMRGFYEGRYRGESAVVTTLQYTYPIWVFLDGFLFADVGNVFGEHFDGFDVEKMVGSFGFGFRSNDDRDVAFNLLFGLGTTQIEEDFEIESFRFLIGTTRGF